MKTARMLYAGSFDPITVGHLDVITRAARLTDELVIGMLRNANKSSYFTEDERMEMIAIATEGMPQVRIDRFGGLLADYIREQEIDVIVRGLRATVDFEYEIQLAQMNAHITGGRTETIFLMTDPRYSYVSSSLTKEVFALGGEIEGLVPPGVYQYMQTHRKEST
jgi:pantetheine-phosphate adenylyltransferase